MWQAMFSFTNAVVVIAWLILAFLPRKPLAMTAVLYLGVGLLCLCYTVMFVALLSGGVDPGLVAGAQPYVASDYSIAGLRKLFMSDGGLVIGWTHYLAFDLFTGLWIARDADNKGFGRAVQLPFLVATFMAGPIGLFTWLIVRERRAREMHPAQNRIRL
ncbi:MAG: ABA4-like family protein [Pseudomonadota bacterium]